MSDITRETATIVGEWLFYLDDQLVKRERNLIVQAGLIFLTTIVIRDGGQTNDIPFYCALGSGTTAPMANDVKLENETFRKFLSAKTRQANLARLRTFFLASEANSTHTEFGIFLAGTSAKDSGTLLNRIVLTGGVIKTSQQVLTVECRLIFAAG
ncbi:MAG: hypothetical protein AB1815_02555 [Bacillota bacterium]